MANKGQERDVEKEILDDVEEALANPSAEDYLADHSMLRDLLHKD